MLRVVILTLLGLAAAKDGLESTVIVDASDFNFDTYVDGRSPRFLEDDEEEEEPCEDVGDGMT